MKSALVISFFQVSENLHNFPPICPGMLVSSPLKKIRTKCCRFYGGLNAAKNLQQFVRIFLQGFYSANPWENPLRIHNVDICIRGGFLQLRASAASLPRPNQRISHLGDCAPINNIPRKKGNFAGLP